MSRNRWNAGDVPDQTGRTVFITGATAGIGYETARVLAARGATLLLGVRDPERGGEVVRRILAESPAADVRLHRLDLASLPSVRETAADIVRSHERVDLLVNNAGVMWTPRTVTADGHELQFATNHLGHFVLTGLLLDRMRDVPGSRVVTVSSLAHRHGRLHLDDPHLERGYSRHGAYSRSKLANLLFTYELQRRLASKDVETIAVAAHPGITRTELVRHSPAGIQVLHGLFHRLYTQSARAGALPTLRAATDPQVRGGQYYGPAGPSEFFGSPQLTRSNRRSRDLTAMRDLWTLSEELTGVVYPV